METPTRTQQLFELSLLGGAAERRYRRLRPEVEAMPWGTLRDGLAARPPEQILAARQVWTRAAFQEHRTGAACAKTLEALIAARAPLDLIAVATRFPLDEMAHVELCARLCAELGGGIPLLHDPLRLVLIHNLVMTKRQELHYMAELSDEETVELYLDTV